MYKYNIRHKGCRPCCDNHECHFTPLSSTEQLPWWLRPALCMMKLQISRSSVAQSACCLLKALKAKLLIIIPLYHCIMFCPFLLSPWVTAPWGNEGGNRESFLGLWNSSQLRTHVYHGWQCDSFVWAVKPEEWAKEREEPQQCIADCIRQILFSVPFLLLLSLVKHNSCNSTTLQ